MYLRAKDTESSVSRIQSEQLNPLPRAELATNRLQAALQLVDELFLAHFPPLLGQLAKPRLGELFAQQLIALLGRDRIPNDILVGIGRQKRRLTSMVPAYPRRHGSNYPAREGTPR